MVIDNEFDDVPMLEEIEINQIFRDDELETEQVTDEHEDTRDHRKRTTDIINNNFNKVEIEIKKTSFIPDEQIEEDDLISSLHDQFVETRVHELISTHEIYSKFNIVDEVLRPDGKLHQKSKSLKKGDINLIFEYLLSEMKDLPHYEVFYGMAYYYDLEHSKLFEFIANKHKTKVLRALIKMGQVLTFNQDIKLH